MSHSESADPKKLGFYRTNGTYMSHFIDHFLANETTLSITIEQINNGKINFRHFLVFLYRAKNVSTGRMGHICTMADGTYMSY